MNKNIKSIIKISLILLLLVCLLALIPIRSNAINRFMLSPFEKKLAMAFQFKTSKIWLPGNIFLEGITASDKGGMLYRAESLNIKYNIQGLLFGKKEMSFCAKEVKFYKDIGLLNSVSRILTIPQMPNVDFNAIEGDFNFQKDATYIKKASARSGNMVIRGEGLIKNNGDLDCNVHFSFSKPIVDSIPDIIKMTLLSEENNGWMGITLKTTGNYAKPSLHIDSETFKMNIKETIIKFK